jgi:hypothetical protein
MPNVAAWYRREDYERIPCQKIAMVRANRLMVEAVANRRESPYLQSHFDLRALRR